MNVLWEHTDNYGDAAWLARAEGSKVPCLGSRNASCPLLDLPAIKSLIAALQAEERRLEELAEDNKTITVRELRELRAKVCTTGVPVTFSVLLDEIIRRTLAGEGSE